MNNITTDLDNNSIRVISSIVQDIEEYQLSANNLPLIQKKRFNLSRLEREILKRCKSFLRDLDKKDNPPKSRKIIKFTLKPYIRQSRVLVYGRRG